MNEKCTVFKQSEMEGMISVLRIIGLTTRKGSARLLSMNEYRGMDGRLTVQINKTTYDAINVRSHDKV